MCCVKLLMLSQLHLHIDFDGKLELNNQIKTSFFKDI